MLDKYDIKLRKFYIKLFTGSWKRQIKLVVGDVALSPNGCRVRMWWRVCRIDRTNYRSRTESESHRGRAVCRRLWRFCQSIFGDHLNHFPYTKKQHRSKNLTSVVQYDPRNNILKVSFLGLDRTRGSGFISAKAPIFIYTSIINFYRKNYRTKNV